MALGNAPDARILRWRYQHVGIFWRCLTLKFALAPTPTPDASQWNIGGVGSSGVGHVYFMYISCCLCIIFRVGYTKISRRKGSFQWNMGFRYYCRISVQREGGERGHRVLSALQDGEGAHRGLEYRHLILHQVSLPGISIHYTCVHKYRGFVYGYVLLY